MESIIIPRIMNLLKEKQMTFGEIYKALHAQGYMHRQMNIAYSLKKMIAKGIIVKLDPDSTHPRYKIVEQ